ncbi:GNAT family N-acetyltransferase [Streptomyces sp. VRA16 Mangrove soil]|uniref:GNAT family N-acetyltransferase n=1 Tax=Streptomyces sp. VRA16 Mangrove soil TaxID=2817434 RepID=UPI001A9FAC3E|nr:GNAT family N-acetyltransferase [Streptomyces sp. VRA16 Mangrove soil]MBO1333810.1 GNAT family N-acetyltransferase [Streptomyces sp. VRA16 Mangrove soil]
MTDLRIEPLTSGSPDALLADWQHAHNTIVPAASARLSLDDVRERAGRNVLEVAYEGDVLVGCTTVRRPREDGTATVIARVLPEHRGRGLGTALYERGLAAARGLGARSFETVLLASNTAGLRFAERAGFTVEVDRYQLDGDPADCVWVELRLA